ncbi:hypothetical protein KBD59_01655 [Candidatus Gracilibacteria bacterium]|nr:hypothetical protein [Candidatus Gracilibacteria bacterium]
MFTSLFGLRELERKRFIYRGRSPELGKPISDVAVGHEVISQYIEENKQGLDDQIGDTWQERRELMNAFLSAGLSIIEKDEYGEDKRIVDDLVNEVRTRDDGGKLVDVHFTVNIKSAEDAQKAIKICRERKILALPIGSRTSAQGLFEARHDAEKYGLNGVVGLQMTRSKESLQLPTEVPEGYELVEHPSLPLAVLKSKSFPEDPKKPHRVIAGAGISVGEVNDFLNEQLGSERYRYRILANPTSKDQATVGGIFTTGAEGGDRYKATKDILRALIVNGDGEQNMLEQTAAQQLVGLAGNAGMVTQAEFGVSAFPKHEHGVFIPVKGAGKEGWKNMLKLQARLKKFCHQKEEGPFQVGDEKDGTIVTGLEPLSRNAVEAATHDNETPFARSINGLMQHYEYGIYVAFSSFNDVLDDDFFESKFLKTLGLNQENFLESYEFSEKLEVLDKQIARENNWEAKQRLIAERELLVSSDEQFLAKADGGNIYDSIRILPTGRELSQTGANFDMGHRKLMDDLRHSAPEKSRERARELGGVTESTDLNIQIQTDDIVEEQQAIDKLAEIFSEYEREFAQETGFRVNVYGHMHPGGKSGTGGIDPHIRIILELSNPAIRYNAPELVQMMKKAQGKLYNKLLGLNGTNGIKILPPEKNLFKNTDFWQWYCLYEPEKARQYLEAILQHGFSHDADGKPEDAIMGARIPHVLPGILPRKKGSLNDLFNADCIDPRSLEDLAQVGPAWIAPIVKKYLGAILEQVQISHRMPGVQRLVGDTALTFHEKFGLAENQYDFFIDSTEEGHDIVERNFGKKHGYNVFEVNATPEDLASGKQICPANDNAIYLVNVEGLGVPRGLTMMVAPQAAIKDAYERTQRGENKAAFRNLHEMWTKWPHETLETPNLPGIAALGLILQQDELEGNPAKPRKNPIKTLNPGPAQLHESLFDIEALFKEIAHLTPAQLAEREREIAEQFKKWTGIPEDHRLAFVTSATQGMQLLSDAIGKNQDKIEVFQIVNDAFGERLNSVLKSKVKQVNTITTPWTTTETSEMEHVMDELVPQLFAAVELGKEPVIYTTPQKTSTAASYNPKKLREAIERRSKELGRALKMGKDFHIICDVTSGVGAIDYATHHESIDDDEEGTSRIEFNGWFGAMQKAMGLPAGFGFVSLSKKLAKLLGVNGDGTESNKFSLSKAISDTENGKGPNGLAVHLLKRKLDAEEAAERTPKSIQEETRKKIELVMGWKQRHKDLMMLVQNAADQSPIMMGLFSQAKNLSKAKSLLSEIFGYYIGEGYGPFAKEAIRLYLPNIAYEDLKRLLAALDRVLELDDVKKTRGEDIPNIATREPIDPYNALSRLSEEMTVDDIFYDSSAVEWLGRLVNTYNANMSDDDSKVRIDDEIPDMTGGFAKKAQIYKYPKNLEEMKKILSIKDEDGVQLTHYYGMFRTATERVRTTILESPNTEYGNNDVSKLVDRNMADARAFVKKIVRLLGKYFKDTEGPHAAARNKKGRPEVAFTG